MDPNCEWIEFSYYVAVALMTLLHAWNSTQNPGLQFVPASVTLAIIKQ